MATITRKITLYPIGDKEEVNRVYRYIRNGQKVQAIMMNQCISALYTAKMNGATKEEIKEISKHYSHIPSSSKGSPYDYDMELFPTGLPLAGSIPRACKQKLDVAFKNGLKYGKVSLPTFKDTNPMMVHNAYINLRGSKNNDCGLYHEYDFPGALCDALLNEKDPNIAIKFANNINFKIVFGAIHRSLELRNVFIKIFDGTYKICDSSIGVYNNKIILNLTLDVEYEKQKLDEKTVVGVDLGLATPAVCALNNNLYKRERIGSYNDFTAKRVKMQAQKDRLKKSLKATSGGHGRKKKLAHLEKITQNERNFARNYNHFVSSEIIKFALRNNAGQINIESLSLIPRERKDTFVLRNWSYYELQQMIKYKAGLYGIKVNEINPAYTSQICSVCGEKGIRNTQSSFICTNPECNSTKIYENMKSFNADFNAARNIAISEDFVTDEIKKQKKKTKKQKKAS